ncbi:probable glutathione S-transferase [Cornus florida]|uniref:probable glutathione S-transferase n=1 Tax=Cornus florida TaxID=4283 RepID=UPI00289ED8FD|nr:probable glutathione S-transferase [Cornus florida]
MEGEEEVKLLGAWYSPFVQRVKWGLKMKGVQYQDIEQDLTNKSPLLLNSNPIHKRVPVLLHSTHKPISESLVIVEYIDETWEHNPLLPKDPYQRAMARFWAKFAEEKFTEVVRKTVFLDGEKQEKEVMQAIDALEIIEGELKGKKFFGGDTVGYVDIVMGWIAVWLGVVEEVAGIKVFDPLKFPCLDTWMGCFLELPFIKEDLPPRDNLVAYFHNYRQFVLASPAQI